MRYTPEQVAGRQAHRKACPAVGLLDLHNADDGKSLSITLFGTEEDLRQGDATLSSMDPPNSALAARRVSVEMYEVTVKIDA